MAGTRLGPDALVSSSFLAENQHLRFSSGAMWIRVELVLMFRFESADNGTIFVSGVHVPFTKSHGISVDFSRVCFLPTVRIWIVWVVKIL